MAKFKCKMCGAPLEVSEGQTVVTCAFCQSKQTVANADDERKENLFNRANSLRSSCDFDKAILSYQSILSIFPNEPEAHWGLCLCKYGIEYVDDPSSHKKIPTIHRMSFDSILKDSDYLAALSYADVLAREEYQEEANQIANIQKNILSISQKEEPFDIFICYKETSNSGKRTPDSVLAQEIYSNLTDKGYKVFFSRITLESKLGSMYEPYIFAALNSAKIMLVIGTKKEYFESVWVRNEWARFIDMMKTRPDHYLIPCYKDMDAYEMPEQFLSFQGQDMGKLGFMQDLLRGIDKIMGRSEAHKVQTETKIIQTDVNVFALLKRAEILISDGNFTKADELLERVLDNDPTNSQAYLLKLLIELEFTSFEQLKTLDDTIETNGNFRKAYNFGDQQQKAKLSSINEFIVNRNEEARLSKLYDSAIDLKNSKRYAEAEAAFSQISGYRDSAKQALECVNLGKEDIYLRAVELKKCEDYESAIETFEKIKEYKDSEYQISECNELIIKSKYEKAIQLKENGMFDAAISIFMDILKFQDADAQVDECERLKTEAKKEAVYSTCLFNREINPYFDMQVLKKACEKLATIPGYKDANQLLTKYEGIIKDYEAELAKKKEEAKRAKAKKVKKIKKISLISAVTSLVLTGVLLLTFLFLIPTGRQNNIQSLIDSGKYEDALSLIEENGNFGDTKNLESMCKAGIAFKNLDYETGIDYIYNIGGSVDVKYDNNGGNSEKGSETIKRARNYVDNNAEKSGYDFHGWLLTDYAIDSKSHYASINLEAQYNVITYNISYTLNGGSSSIQLPTTYTTEEAISLPNPTKEGYTFLGWTGLDIPTPTVDYVIPVGSIGNKSYIANWKANEYTIYLNPNGGTVSQQEVKATYDSVYSLPTPNYNGYDFKGWFDSSSTKYSGGTYKVPSDLYLNASWEAHNYTISYNLNGGINDSRNPLSYKIVDSDIILRDPTRTGYTFIGWTCSQISVPTKGVKIESGTTGNLSFEANWQANTYNVTIDLDGGESDKTSYSFVYDSTYSIVNPTRVGYSFEKFTYNGETVLPSSGTWKIAEDITIKATWLANSDTPYIINYYTENLDGDGYTKAYAETSYGYSDKSVTLTAKTFKGFTPIKSSQTVTIAANGSTVVDFYSRNSYIISFVTNGGSSIESETYKYEEQIPSTLKATRTGYTFAGWYTDEKQTTLFDKMPASDQTVYAYYSEETKASFFTYSFSGQEVTITKGNGLSGSVVVPEYIAGKLVTAIGNNAFENCSAVTEITLSDSVNELGSFAFKGCSSLVRINGTSNLSAIKDSTFEGCSALAYFPDLSNVTSIGDNAFKGCSSLTTFTISDSLTSIGNYAFENCVMLLQTPDLTNVTSIGDYAFKGCTLLSEIKSLDGCATFGEGIFTACENIAKITLSFKESIEQFYVSSFFKEIVDSSKYYGVTGKNGSIYYIPKRLTEIEYDTTGKTPDYFLYGLTSITKVTDKSDSTIQIGKHAFDGCTKLTDYSIQNSVVSLVDEYAFKGCSSLSSVSGFDLEEVKNYAFADCSSLLAAPILENATYVGDYAFSGCSLITSIIVPNASYMGLSSLFGCSALEELEIPFVGTNINSTEAFGVIFGMNSYYNSYETTQLSKTYYIPNGLRKLAIGGNNIKENTCAGLISITNLIVCDSVESIGNGAFNGCNSLENITLPFVGKCGSAEYNEAVFGYIFGMTITERGGYIVSYDGATGAEYSDAIKGSYSRSFVNRYSFEVGRGDFPGKTWQYSALTYSYNYSYYLTSWVYDIPSSIKSVIITSQISIPTAAFNNCSFIEDINLPNCTETIGSSAFQNCTSLKQLNSNTDGVFNIPTSVKFISSYAFYNCSLAEAITLSDEVTTIGSYAFAGCSLVSKFNSDNSTELIVPKLCEEIGDYAFKGMALITNVIVSDSVESIGKDTFNGFNSLESITLPFVGGTEGASDYTSVFGYIFGNSSYSNSYVPASIRSVSVTRQVSIPAEAFNGCTTIEKITLSDEVTSIGSSAFKNCYSLKQLNSNTDGVFNIPTSVKFISSYAFYNCSLAEAITLSDEVTTIEYDAFAGCSLVSKFNSDNSTELIVPKLCETIGDYAFKGMALITNVIIPDSVESIGVGAFKGFNSLESITLPFVGKSDDAENYEAVFGYIFGYETKGQGSGTSYNSPHYDYVNEKIGSVEGAVWQYTCNTYRYAPGYNYYYYINSYYYYIPASLRNVTVTVDTTIPLAAFNNCSSIEIISLPDCVDTIGDYAFQNCTAAVNYSISPSKSGVWNGTSIATTYHGGTGTQQDPYQIFSAKEFVYFLNQINNGENYKEVYFVLTSNINLGGFSVDSTSLTEDTAFKGILDGNSHKVFNFSINETDNTYNGLFGYMGGAIKNIGFETSMTITTSKTTDVYVGLIIGNLSGTLENVYVLGTLTSTSLRTSYVGGLVGYSTGSIINSYSNVSVTATSTNLKCYAAGMIGYNDGSITGSFAYGNVSAKGYAESYSYASGLVSFEGVNSNVENCYRYSGQTIEKFGNPSTSYNEIGIVASLEEIISYCKANWNGDVWSFENIFPTF